jgi:BirA family biotin operon repressor/biotin-[acetyl-CoA-carboxylase] ligase
MSIKNDVLAILESQRSAYVSGQELADTLHVTRTSIWKAVKTLEEDGHIIDAVSNRGYRLSPSSDVLSREGILAERTSNIHAPVLVLKTVDSTNTYAKKLAIEGAAHGTLVVAEEQTAGRGRYGKSFFSPKGTGLYMSVILRPGTNVSAAQMVTVAAAVSVCETIEAITGLSPQIKWVNDVFLSGKKVCGILSEAGTNFETGEIDYIIVGIGVNCSTLAQDFPPEIRSLAASVSYDGLIRNRLCSSIYDCLIAMFEHLSDRSIIDAYRDRSMMLNRRISFTFNGVTLQGVAMDINDAGNLIVRCDSGDTITLVGGEVSFGSDNI